MLLNKAVKSSFDGFEQPVLKSYLISESFLWSGWDFVVPLIAAFVVTQVPGGSAQHAAWGYSTYLLSRVVFELFTGKSLKQATEGKKLIMAVTGITLLSFGYLGFFISSTVVLFYISYFILGAGLGIASPAKNSLFAQHLDKNKGAQEWAVYDAFTFLCMAAAAAISGFMVKQFGFQVIFLIAAILNFLGIWPYILLKKKLFGMENIPTKL